MTAINNYLQGLAEQRFWGFLTLKFEHGEVVHLRREENLKPTELPGRNRGNANANSNQ